MPRDPRPRDAIVIGAGPAGLMAAETLSRGGVRVTVYDRMPSAGRKFLLAGRGGLNLTHSEEAEAFRGRYGGAARDLGPSLEAFSPSDLRAWCEALGEPTFVGSSGRVFPKSFKTSPLLRAWLRRLDASGVAFRPRHHWLGFDPDGGLMLETPQGGITLRPGAAVLALGGASWPHLGSDGGWVVPMGRAGVAIEPLRPSNCGFLVSWSRMFRERFQGLPLKGIRLSFDGLSLRGEATVTRAGLEGGGVYALSARLRDAIFRDGSAVLRIALRPQLGADEIEARLAGRLPKQSLSTFLGKALKLSPPAIGLLQEVAIEAGIDLATLATDRLAERINDVPVRLLGTAPLDRAISTAGGVAFAGLDTHLMLRARPGCFVAGEMLDWEAPTGGYLLQAAFATGARAGAGALARLAEERADRPADRLP